MVLDQIWVYPIKSLPGCRVHSTELQWIGCTYDRSFMLIDSSGKKITQRSHPLLSQIQIELQNETACIRYRGQEIYLNLTHEMHGQLIQSQVWNDSVVGIDTGDQYNHFFSDVLNENVRLIKKTGERKNILPNSHAIESSLADSLPLLVTGTASLAYIQNKLQEDFNFMHFRPNLIFETSEPFLEDRVSGFRIGSAEIQFGKQCGRCAMINVNPEDGSLNKRRLPELGKIRLDKNKIYFGSLFYPSSLGRISEGDQITPIFE
ncbi:MAG: MOSC domain-containing protein [Bacteroidota bacterium]|jgi:uncharacterized protein YcbX